MRLWGEGGKSFCPWGTIKDEVTSYETAHSAPFPPFSCVRV